MKYSALLILIISSFTAFGQATFESASGNVWNNASTWNLTAGSDADGIPDADDDVIINSHTISVSSTAACNNLTISNAGAVTTSQLTLFAATITINGDLNFEDGVADAQPANFYINGAGTVNILGSIIYDATDGSNSTFDIRTTCSINIAGDVSASASGRFNVNTSGGSATVTLNGSGEQFIKIGSGFEYPNLTVSNGTIAYLDGTTGSIEGNLTISDGILKVPFALSLNPAGTKTFTIEPNGTLELTGSGNYSIPTNFTTYDFQDGSTILVTGASIGISNSTAGFTSINAYNFTVDNGSTVTLSDSLKVRGVLNLTSGALNIANFDVELPSNASGTGTIYSASGGSIGYTGSGKVQINRYLADGVGWTLLSTAITNTTHSDWGDDLTLFSFQNGGNADVYTWNEVSQAYDSISDAAGSGSLNASLGYFLYLYNDGSTVNQRGNVRTTDFSTSVTNSGAGSYPGFNLVPNPFHCPITADSVKIGGSSISGAAILTSSATASGTNYSTKTGAAEIAPGEAFWVQATSSGTLSIPAVAQSNSGIDTYNSDKNADNSYFAVVVTNDSIQDEDYVYFKQNDLATADYDANQLDMIKLSSTGIYHNISTTTSTNDLAINSVSSFETLIAPLKIYYVGNNSNTSMNLKLSLNNINHLLSSGYCVTVEDLLLNTTHQITSEFDTIPFTTSTNYNQNRFMLNVLKPMESLATEPICYNDGTGKIVAQTTIQGTKTFNWYTNNQLIQSTSTSTVSDSIIGLNGGNYSLELVTNEACASINSDITLVQPAEVISDFSMSTDTLYINYNEFVALHATAQNASELVWKMGDGTQYYGLEDITHTYQSVGLFTVELEALNQNQCSSKQLKTITVLNNTSIAEINENKSVNAWLSNNQLNIISEIDYNQLELRDINGKLLFTFAGSHKSNHNLPNLAKGVYLVTLYNNSKQLETIKLSY